MASNASSEQSQPRRSPTSPLAGVQDPFQGQPQSGVMPMQPPSPEMVEAMLASTQLGGGSDVASGSGINHFHSPGSIYKSIDEALAASYQPNSSYSQPSASYALQQAVLALQQQQQQGLGDQIQTQLWQADPEAMRPGMLQQHMPFQQPYEPVPLDSAALLR